MKDVNEEELDDPEVNNWLSTRKTSLNKTKRSINSLNRLNSRLSERREQKGETESKLIKNLNLELLSEVSNTLDEEIVFQSKIANNWH